MPSKETYKVFANFVDGLAGLSKCTDKHTSAIICDKDLHQIYSIGVNGGPRKAGDDLECLCATETKYSCIHAEANALIKLQERVPDKIMICSLAPCTQCASMIVNEPGGFKAVLFLEEWKEPIALSLLMDAGIRVGKIDLDGNVTLASIGRFI